MQVFLRKSISAFLAILLCVSMLSPTVVVSHGIGTTLVIQDDKGTEITTRQTIREYDTMQLKYVVPEGMPEGAYVRWSSDLPLLAGVDDTGLVRAFDYSKAAIIHMWLDENVRILPLVGDAMADSILAEIQKTGVDLDDMKNETIVLIVRGIAGDMLADALQKVLDNMNVAIHAVLYDVNGKKITEDIVEFVVEKNLFADALPTGAHITNRKVVPTTVAVGTTVQLRGAITPMRLHHTVKWSVGGGAFDTESKKHATVTGDGLVTFTSAGKATIKVSSAQNLASSTTIEFTILDPKDLPVQSFDIVGKSSVKEGETTQLGIANVVPEGAYTGDLIWETENPAVALIDQTGLVIGLDGGDGLAEYSKEVNIKATVGTSSGTPLVKTAPVTVSRAGVTGDLSSLSIEGPAAMPIGTPSSYTSNVLPARLNANKSLVREWGLLNRETQEITWATAELPAENAFVRIDYNGFVTPLASGQVTIVAKATFNGKNVQSQKDITIGKAIESFQIIGTTTIDEGKTTQLTISNIAPADYDQAILDTAVWSVADPTVASVTQTGLVLGLDCKSSNLLAKKTTQVIVTIGGISQSIDLTVKKVEIGSYTGGQIIGPDYVIKDFPVTFSSTHTPERIQTTRQYWGVVTDDGAAPWNPTNTMGSDNLAYKFKGNMQNSLLKVDAATDGSAVTGKLIGLEAGQTTIHHYMARYLTTSQNLTKNIEVVEIQPESIAIEAPTKTEYIEGNTTLDTTGMKVKLTYKREDIAKYYGEEIANQYTIEQLTVPVTDYKISEINTNILDTEQYILVTVNRAGKAYNAVFKVLVKSKEVTGITLKAPKYDYREGDKILDLTGLEVTAQYANAEPETVTDYVVNESEFDPNLLDVEQQITVTYTHAGRTASASFPVIVYGIPVVSVNMGDYTGNWTPKDITIALSSTHDLDGIRYYYKTDANPTPILVEGNTLTIQQNNQDVYYFKAVNGKGISGEFSEGYIVKRDDVTPSFTLAPTVSNLTNQTYAVNIENLSVGLSGISKITLNGDLLENSATTFPVEQNGIYRLEVTANNGLSFAQEIDIQNIDKEAPTVTQISLAHKEQGTIARLLQKLTFNIFFHQEVEISITAEDTGVAGLETIEYRFLDETGTPIDAAWQVYDANHKPTQKENFKGYVEARAKDKAQNLSDVLRSDGYVIDSINPTDIVVTAIYQENPYVSNTWVAGDVQIQLQSTAFSEIYAYYYQIDGGEWQEMVGDTFTATQIGTHTYAFKAVSYSTLESPLATMTVKIDRQVPVIRVDFEGTFGRWTGEGVTFHLHTQEASLSGITYYYNNGNGWTQITTGENIEIRENVNATYAFKAVNAAGTESYPSDSYKVMCDIEVPTLTLTPSVQEMTIEPYTIGIEATAGAAGVQSVLLNGQDITGQTEVTVSKNGTYVFTVLGNNGKISTKIIEITNFQEEQNDALILFFANGGDGKMPSVTLPIGSEYRLPANTFIAPKGMHFLKWNLGKPGDTIMITEHTVLSAEWAEGTEILEAGTLPNSNTTWHVRSDGRLEIDGKGEFTQSTAWQAYQAQVSYVSVAEGFQTIGASSFQNFEHLQYVRIPLTANSLHPDMLKNLQGNPTILVFKGSSADTSAIANRAYLGDMNGDGDVQLSDYQLLVEAVQGIGVPLNAEQEILADCNGDSVVDAFDLALLRQSMTK